MVVFGWTTSWLPLKWLLGVVVLEVSLLWRFLIVATVMFVVTFLSFTVAQIWLAFESAYRNVRFMYFPTNFAFFIMVARASHLDC